MWASRPVVVRVHSSAWRLPGLAGVALGDQGVDLTVENTGELLAPEMVSTLAAFLRIDERGHAGRAGVGLGLTIVESITEDFA